MATEIQLGPNWKVDALLNTAIGFFTTNPLVEANRLAIETDTGKAKMGDGTKRWNELTFITFNDVTSFLPVPATIPHNAITIDAVTGGLKVLEGLNADRFSFFTNPVLTTSEAIDLYNTNKGPATSQGRIHILQLYFLIFLIKKSLGGSLATGISVDSPNAPVKTADSRLAALEAISSDDALNAKINALLAGIISDTTTEANKTWSSNKITNHVDTVTNAKVQAAVAALVGSSPTALDTIYELAAAIQENQGGITTILNNIAGAIKVTSQSFTLEQQEQARINIGAASTIMVGELPADGTSDPYLDDINPAMITLPHGNLLPNIYE